MRASRVGSSLGERRIGGGLEGVIDCLFACLFGSRVLGLVGDEAWGTLRGEWVVYENIAMGWEKARTCVFAGDEVLIRGES